MADDTRQDDAPALAFEPDTRVSLGMTQLSECRTQLPHGALGRVIAPLDETGSRWDVEFDDFEGIPTNEDGVVPARANVPAFALERVARPPAADHRSDAEQDEAEDWHDVLVVGSCALDYEEAARRYDHPVKEVAFKDLLDRVRRIDRALLERYCNQQGLSPDFMQLLSVTAGKVDPENRHGEGIEFHFHYRPKSPAPASDAETFPDHPHLTDEAREQMIREGKRPAPKPEQYGNEREDAR